MEKLKEEIKEAKNNKLFGIFKKFKKPGKNMFWAWIIYQSVKGTLTLSFIWIPLIYIWFTTK